MDRNLYLCGFMGSGKSTVGRELAAEMERSFYDLDEYIVEKEGMPITEIFARHGEAGFRDREAMALREISGRGHAVVACGGGTVLFDRNLRVIHEARGVIFLLDVPVQVLQERLRDDTERPLLQTADRNGTIAALYGQRSPLYRRAADYIVPANVPPPRVAERIIGFYGKVLLQESS